MDFPNRISIFALERASLGGRWLIGDSKRKDGFVKKYKVRRI